MEPVPALPNTLNLASIPPSPLVVPLTGTVTVERLSPRTLRIQLGPSRFTSTTIGGDQQSVQLLLEEAGRFDDGVLIVYAESW